MTLEEFEQLLAAPEGTRLEFKEARNRFDVEVLLRYCVALANEGGGKIVLGVTDGRPRRVVGTSAFPEPGRIEAHIYQEIGRQVRIEEIQHENGRVLIFHVPPRVPGSAWSYKGAFLKRAGDAVVPMTDEDLRRIHAEVAPDFSAEYVDGVTAASLDPGVNRPGFAGGSNL